MRYLDEKRLVSNIESRMRGNMDAGIIGGASVWVWQDGKELYRRHFGEGVSDKTVYRLASMTKPITAVAVLTLVEQGKLSLNDPVDKFFPEYRDIPILSLDNGKLVKTGMPKTMPTVMHMLTHTSGLGGGAAGEAINRLRRPEDLATLQASVAFYARMGLVYEPFTQVTYSGTASFDILSAIVEKISGKSYDAYLQEAIFSPCGMVDTTFAPAKEQWDRMIPMHDRIEGKSQIGHTWDGCVFENVPVTHFAGGAGLASTLEDYTHFARMLLQKGEFGGNRVLKPETVALMATPHLSETLMPRTKRWGLAVKVVTSPEYGRLPLGCYGWSGAYGTHFWVDPENRIAAIFMKNSHYDGGGDAVTSAEFEEDVTNALKG